MSLKAVGWATSLPVANGVKAARDWARTHLDQLGWTTSVPETADAVLLTVSELVTNAHVHAHSDAQLVLVWDCRCLQVSVSDTSQALPATRDADDERPSGRGLVIVDALADDWETHQRAAGKTVTTMFHAPDCPGGHMR